MRRPMIAYVALSLSLTLGLTYYGLARTPRLRDESPAATEQGIAVYFSPRGGCEHAVVEQIERAKKTVDMQAYSFTNHAIGAALVAAVERGVKVRIVLDEKAAREQHREPDFTAEHHASVYTDGLHQIAHNKVIVVDGETVITGSFNFTQQAEESNAENLLVIDGKEKIAKAYEENFERHRKHSNPYELR